MDSQQIKLEEDKLSYQEADPFARMVRLMMNYFQRVIQMHLKTSKTVSGKKISRQYNCNLTSISFNK